MPAAKMETRRTFHTDGPQLLGASAHNLVAHATWRQDLCTPAVVVIIYGLGERFLEGSQNFGEQVPGHSGP
jgi:hypothetical protein